jgi:hypothetical protein
MVDAAPHETSRDRGAHVNQLEIINRRAHVMLKKTEGEKTKRATDE